MHSRVDPMNLFILFATNSEGARTSNEAVYIVFMKDDEAFACLDFIDLFLLDDGRRTAIILPTGSERNTLLVADSIFVATNRRFSTVDAFEILVIAGDCSSIVKSGPMVSLADLERKWSTLFVDSWEGSFASCLSSFSGATPVVIHGLISRLESGNLVFAAHEL